MCGPFADEYWKAPYKKIDTFKRTRTWEIFNYTPNMDAIDST